MGELNSPTFGAALLSGAAAGLSVDVALFPLDTVKTRLQSAEGFWKTGGFRGIYSGLGSVAVGSMPSAALFFCTYETVKSVVNKQLPEQWHFMGHSLAASCGEVVGCLVRVPTEVIKQRAQAKHSSTSYTVLTQTLKQEGFRGLYRGYWSTVFREVPFSFLQFPLWEFFKKYWSESQGEPVLPWQSAICGAVAGGLAAGVTTPLDVAKTRIMLAEKSTALATGSIIYAMQVVHREKGTKGLFAGITPRTIWISLGGFIFMGTYEKVNSIIQKRYPNR